jgi:hypothetical protein
MTRFLFHSGPARADGGPPGWRLVGVLVALAGLAGPARAATPRDDLLELVPGDVGFCLIVSDLREHTRKVLDTAWFKALRDSPLARAVAQAPEARKLAEVEDRLKKRLKIDLARLRDDILGDAVVFAYRPGPPDEPNREQGLFLVWARDAKLLGQVVQALNEDLKELQTLDYKDVKYSRRVEAKGTSNFYYQSGQVLAFSPHEEMIRQVIERSLASRTSGKGKAAPSLAEQLRRLGAERALAVLWFNPRAFEAHVRQGFALVKGPEAFALKAFLQYWQAVEGIAVTLAVHKDVEVKVAVRARTEALPAPARKFFEEPSRRSELWDRYPPNPLLAVADRVDAVALADTLGAFVPPEARKAFLGGLNRGLAAGLGLDVANDVLPNLGPDWGFCVAAPADKKILVPLLTVALRVRPGPKVMPVDQALLGGLNSFALFAVISYNQRGGPDTLRLASVKQDMVEVKYLENDKLFPAGLRPAFAVKDGYLLLTSAPEAVFGFSKRQSTAPNSPDVPLLRMSLRELSQFLKDRREPITKYLAGKDNISPEQAAQQLDGVLGVLDLFDGLELSQRTGAGLATWTLRVQMAEPARK